MSQKPKTITNNSSFTIVRLLHGPVSVRVSAWLYVFSCAAYILSSPNFSMKSLI